MLERITSMLNGNGKLSSVSTTNVCKRDEDVLLRTNARTIVKKKRKMSIEDELHTRDSLLRKTKVNQYYHHIC